MAYTYVLRLEWMDEARDSCANSYDSTLTVVHWPFVAETTLFCALTVTGKGGCCCFFSFYLEEIKQMCGLQCSWKGQ